MGGSWELDGWSLVCSLQTVALVSQGSVVSLPYSRGEVPAIFIYVSGVHISSSVRANSTSVVVLLITALVIMSSNLLHCSLMWPQFDLIKD